MKLGIVQMQIVMGDKTANLHRAVRGIDEAADEGAELVVLPECCDLGWLSDRAEAEAESYDGVFVSSVAEAATAKGVFVVVGFTERDSDDIYNSAVLIAPEAKSPCITARSTCSRWRGTSTASAIYSSASRPTGASWL